MRGDQHHSLVLVDVTPRLSLKSRDNREPLVWAVAMGLCCHLFETTLKCCLLVSVLGAESFRMRTVATVALRKKHSSFLIGSFCSILKD